MTAEIPLQGKKWSEQNLPNIILLQNDVQIPRLRETIDFMDVQTHYVRLGPCELPHSKFIIETHLLHVQC